MNQEIANVQNNRKIQARCNISRSSDHVYLTMEMPGVSKDNLDIRIDGDLLYIEGSKQLNKVEGDYKIREISHGNYYHTFSVDETIDRNKIEASIKNGIVNISLGIKEAEKPKKITITSK